MNYTLLITALLFLHCTPTESQKNVPVEKKDVPAQTTIAKNKNYRVIRVFVALCDNVHQGIVKVPAAIGNGQDPANNLYWGCGYGTKTWFKKDKDWKLLETIKNPKPMVLERCVFQYKPDSVILVADAYDGAFIRNCTVDFLKSCSGNFTDMIIAGKDTVACGGNGDLLCYVGHNGLMDFQLEEKFAAADSLKREAVILACASKPYFKPKLQQAGAQSLILTTHLMAPEAYTLGAAVDGWICKKSKADIKESVAQAYHQYQQCGIKGARNLFATD